MKKQRNEIIIKGAREHNLKNVNLTIPRDKFIVFTGLSGSGKSSLAFDTIYADGQRRYVESLSSYARMFLGQMDKPDVDSIEGLSPAISIDQKTTSKNPRSTVGTVTEVYDYLRLMYARIGRVHCPVCGNEISKQTIDQIVDKVMELETGTKFQILAPVVKGRKGRHEKELERAKQQGYVRVLVDGVMYDLSEDIVLDKNKKHNIEIVVDRLVMKEDIKSRLSDSLETATNVSDGVVIIDVIGGEQIIYSLNYACPVHDVSIEKIEVSSFSFNSPNGACEKCTGLGEFMEVDPDLIIPKKELSINDGAIKASGWYNAQGSIANAYYQALAKKYEFSLDDKVKDLPEKALRVLLYGSGKDKIKVEFNRETGVVSYNNEFEGIVNNLERRFRETNSNFMRDEISSVMSSKKCPACKGRRLKPEILGITVGDKNISEFCEMSVEESLVFVESLQFNKKEELIAKNIIKEIKDRLGFLNSVGLSYLTLSRSAGTLSGGEAQRIRLATQIGSSLMGVLYILDEPSIGLHQKDNEKLIATLRHLCDLGNTLIVVEHDEDTMYACDYIVDIGPYAGINGGEVVCQGSVEDIINCDRSLTGQYLSGKKKIEVPSKRRKGNKNKITIKGAGENNLKNVNVTILLGTLTCVTGVSGSGKSSLVNEVLLNYLKVHLHDSKVRCGKVRKIEGLENIDKVIDIDQSPIGRTPRSNPATYTGVFTDIRELFATTTDSKMKGYTSSRYSFNVKGGRCEACSGDGIIKIEMHFLPDVYVPCEVCKGKRYNRETLEVKYKDKSIHDVLEMTVDEAVDFFENIPKIKRKLDTLKEVGLSYIKLGQASTTLSGGEAQRVKLATELSKRSTGKTLYILDEPTTGLHTADVHKLIDVLDVLVESGNTVVVIEHNLDVIKTADYIIDLGPDGGDKGGNIVVCGTPEDVARCERSYTGEFLKKSLEKFGD